MFDVKPLKIYYDKAKSIFGTTASYASYKSELEFICMLRERLSNLIGEDGQNMKVDGVEYSIEDFETFLKEKFNIFEDSSRYSDISLIILLMTIASNALFKLINDKSSYLEVASIVMYTVIFSCVFLTVANKLEQRSVVKRNAIKGFYRISYEILLQEKEKKKIKLDK